MSLAYAIGVALAMVRGMEESDDDPRSRRGRVELRIPAELPVSSEPEPPSASWEAKRAALRIRARQLEDLPLEAAGPEEDEGAAPPEPTAGG
jgi:hypothetical protein